MTPILQPPRELNTKRNQIVMALPSKLKMGFVFVTYFDSARPLACPMSCVGLSVEPSDKTFHLLLPGLGGPSTSYLPSEATP